MHTIRMRRPGGVWGVVSDVIILAVVGIEGYYAYTAWSVIPLITALIVLAMLVKLSGSYWRRTLWPKPPGTADELSQAARKQVGKK